jgi:hypothetical protein
MGAMPAFGMQTLGLESTPLSVPWPTFVKYLNQDALNEQGAYWGFLWLSRVYSDPHLRPSIDPNFDPNFQMVVDACLGILRMNAGEIEAALIASGLEPPSGSDASAMCTSNPRPVDCLYRFARSSIGRYRDRRLLLEQNVEKTSVDPKALQTLLRAFETLMKNWTDISDLLFEYTDVGRPARPNIGN